MYSKEKIFQDPLWKYLKIFVIEFIIKQKYNLEACSFVSWKFTPSKLFFEYFDDGQLFHTRYYIEVANVLEWLLLT